MDDTGHTVVIDTATGARRDLGIGHDPTWSPIGDEIAVKMPREHGTERASDHDGHYHVIRVDRPAERRVLLENPRIPWEGLWRPDSVRVGYYGPALWSPDARYIAVRRARGEGWDTYLLERGTGRVERLPRFFKGDSWGGTP
jgi:hypothetical protein